MLEGCRSVEISRREILLAYEFLPEPLACLTLSVFVVLEIIADVCPEWKEARGGHGETLRRGVYLVLRGRSDWRGFGVDDGSVSLVLECADGAPREPRACSSGDLQEMKVKGAVCEFGVSWRDLPFRCFSKTSFISASGGIIWRVVLPCLVESESAPAVPRLRSSPRVVCFATVQGANEVCACACCRSSLICV